MAKAGQSDRLAILGDLYRFPGGLKSPLEVDIEAPLTVVHDVADEVGAVSCLYIQGDVLVTTGGATVKVFSSRTRSQILGLATDALRNLGLNSSRAWLWLCAYNATTSSAAGRVQQILAGFDRPDDALIQNPTTQAKMVAYGNRTATGYEVTSSGGETQIVFRDAGGIDRPFDYLSSETLPQRIEVMRFVSQDDGGGALTVRHSPLYCVTPRGVTPPWP